MTAKIIAVVLTTLIASISSAHGEEKPGPHGGHIQMPAGFHTELIADPNGAFHVYLLDMEFKNPVTQDSSITAYVKNGKKKTSLKCAPMGTTHFFCEAAKPVKTGTLYIRANRAGTQATVDAKYKLPLKALSAPAADTPVQPEDHSKHH